MDLTVIAFSGTGDDYIVVEGTAQEINEALAVGNRSGSGLCQLKQAHGQGPVFVNPEQVAYVRGAANS